MAELLGTNINGNLVVTGSTTINIGDNGVIKINKKINNVDTTIIEISNTGVIKLLGSNAKLEKSLKIKNADGTYSEYNGHDSVIIELNAGAYRDVNDKEDGTYGANALVAINSSPTFSTVNAANLTLLSSGELKLMKDACINLDGKKIYKDIFSYNSDSGILTINY